MEEEGTYPSLMSAYEQVYRRTVSQVHLKRKFVDPLMSTGYLLQDRHPTDGRKWIFEKMIFPDEMTKDAKIYRSLVLEDIYPEDELKEYMNEIKKNSTNK